LDVLFMVFILHAETVCLLVYAGVKPGPSFYGQKKKLLFQN